LKHAAKQQEFREEAMPLGRLAVQELYTKRIDRYSSFINLLQSPQGIQALLQHSDLLRPGLRVLDAGCGFGMATFAFLEALRQRNLDYKSIDAFDLTPAMLFRFQKMLEERGLTRVQLRQADVLNLETLPTSWINYDLILSASVLEYLPRRDLARALEGLHARMIRGGRILVMITRKTPETKVVVEWWRHAERYTKGELLRAFKEAGFRDPVFLRFPLRYTWLNRANYVVVGAGREARAS
jgi:SAM-dependent methyltransferase